MSDVEEVAAFVAALRPVRVSVEGPYTPLDRYRDFHAVFADERGRRVLAQIVDLCEGRPRSIEDVGDHARMAFRDGMRWAGLKITQWAAMPPPAER